MIEQLAAINTWLAYVFDTVVPLVLAAGMVGALAWVAAAALGLDALAYAWLRGWVERDERAAEAEKWRRGELGGLPAAPEADPLPRARPRWLRSLDGGRHVGDGVRDGRLTGRRYRPLGVVPWSNVVDDPVVIDHPPVDSTRIDQALRDLDQEA